MWTNWEEKNFFFFFFRIGRIKVLKGGKKGWKEVDDVAQ